MSGPVPSTPANAAHLLRRATFGGLPADVARASCEGIAATVDRLLFEGFGPPEDPPATPGPWTQIFGGVPRRTDVLQRWWVDRMAHTTAPLRERLTWFWHGHFATSVKKLNADRLVLAQNQTIRAHAAGNLRDLVRAMANDPALVLWLDLQFSQRDRPNENFARELMELFTMGRNQGYAQADVVAAARALTGVDVVEDLGEASSYAYRFSAADHDGGTKTFLGQTGPFGPEDIVEIVLGRPEVPRFVASRFWYRFAAGSPAPPDVLDRLVWAFAQRFEITDLLQALFTEPAFYAPEVKQGLVSSPVELAVRSLRAFDLQSGQVADFVGCLTNMGQEPFFPPNVAGWGHNEAWLTSASAAGRARFARALAGAVQQNDNAAIDHLRSRLGTGPGFQRALFGRLGVTECSATTAAAVDAVVDRAGRRVVAQAAPVLAQAVAVAVCSPEVVMA